MAAVPERRKYSPAEYIDKELATDRRHEYFDGEIVAMAGGSPEHMAITAELHGELVTQLRTGPCRTFVGEARIRSEYFNGYYYPDIVVYCGKPVFDNGRAPVLLNPVVIIEVLSRSTERLDRGLKLHAYQRLESLQAYILVSQTEPLADIYHRQPDGSWTHQFITGLSATLEIPSIEFIAPLSRIYERVTFPGIYMTSE